MSVTKAFDLVLRQRLHQNLQDHQGQDDPNLLVRQEHGISFVRLCCLAGAQILAWSGSGYLLGTEWKLLHDKKLGEASVCDMGEFPKKGGPPSMPRNTSVGAPRQGPQLLLADGAPSRQGVCPLPSASPSWPCKMQRRQGAISRASFDK